jgi:hypothetical protein
VGLKFNREDVKLGAIPVGSYVTSTSTTPAPLDLPNRAVDWEAMPPGTAGQVLTVNADGSIGWATSTALNNPMTSPGDTIYGGTSGAATRLAIGTAGQVLTVNSGATGITWTTAGGTGTVTSVTFTGDGTVLSSTPSTAVTATGTVTAALATQAKNIVLAGPPSGATSVAPTFRALVNADLPAAITAGPITATSATDQVQFVAKCNTTQTSHLSEWQDSSGVARTLILPTGGVAVNQASQIGVPLALGVTGVNILSTAFSASNGFDFSNTYGPMRFYGAGTTPQILMRRAMGVGTTNETAVGDVPLTVNGKTGQTADIQDWSVNNVVLTSIRADGSIALPTLADSAAVNSSLYWSSTTSKLCYKDSSGGLHVTS